MVRPLSPNLYGQKRQLIELRPVPDWQTVHPIRRFSLLVHLQASHNTQASSTPVILAVLIPKISQILKNQQLVSLILLHLNVTIQILPVITLISQQNEQLLDPHVDGTMETALNWSLLMIYQHLQLPKVVLLNLQWATVHRGRSEAV
jgi:hypothetical protein